MGKASRRRRDKYKTRTVKLSPEQAEQLSQQERRFIEKFGRPPGPNDPVFFDTDADVPTPVDIDDMRAGLVEILRQAGADPATIYAVQVTDMLPPIPGHGYSAADLEEWNAAIDRYHLLHPEKPDDPDAGMNARLVEIIERAPEKLKEFMIGLAGLLSKDGGLAGVDELQARIGEMEGEDGVVLAIIFATLMRWLIEIRDGHTTEERQHVVAAALQYADTLTHEDMRPIVTDFSEILVPTGSELTISDLANKHGERNLFLSPWVLIHGAVQTLGDGDVHFLDQFHDPADDGVPTPNVRPRGSDRRRPHSRPVRRSRPPRR